MTVVAAGRGLAPPRNSLQLHSIRAAIVWLDGVAWDWRMMRRRPWSADGLVFAGGAIVGYMAITFVYYWRRRWRHESSVLCRCFHQPHHSQQRIEVGASFYKHPFELLAYSVLSSAILYRT